MKRIKLIKTSDVTANVHFKLIQQEIYLLQHLIHPRIIRLFDYYYSNDGNYIHIIMEYATRGSLAKFIANKINDNQFLNERVRIMNHLTIFFLFLSQSLKMFVFFSFLFLLGNKIVIY